MTRAQRCGTLQNDTASPAVTNRNSMEDLVMRMAKGPASPSSTSTYAAVLLLIASFYLTGCSEKGSGPTRDPVLLDHMYNPDNPVRHPTGNHR